MADAARGGTTRPPVLQTGLRPVDPRGDADEVALAGGQLGQGGVSPHRCAALDTEALLEITSSGSGQGTVELLIDGTLVPDPSAYSLG